ncbi:MAG: MaoC family dehydratase [Rhodospirillales bacterium]
MTQQGAITSYNIDDLTVGMSDTFSKTVSEADINAFAEISGDTNPVHLDETYAKTTPFKGRIAHGMLSAAYVSTVFGTRLPGAGCIYLSQSLKFRAPVKIGDTVVAKVEVTAIDRDRRRVTFATTCSVGDTVVLDGEAQLLVPAGLSAQAAE